MLGVLVLVSALKKFHLFTKCDVRYMMGETLAVVVGLRMIFVAVSFRAFHVQGVASALTAVFACPCRCLSFRMVMFNVGHFVPPPHVLRAVMCVCPRATTLLSRNRCCGVVVCLMGDLGTGLRGIMMVMLDVGHFVAPPHVLRAVL